MFCSILFPIRPKPFGRKERSNLVSKTIALTFGVLAMVFLISFIVLAWTEPTCDPSVDPQACNPPPPLNVGSTPQTKAGTLTITGFIYGDDLRLGNWGGEVTTAGDIEVKDATGGITFFHVDGSTGNVSWSGTLTGGTVPWARLTNFPSACPSGEYVTAVGSSLTCTTTPAGVTTFLGLTDTPTSYTGQAGKAVLVKSDATGLTFGTVGAGTVTSVAAGSGLTASPSDPITTSGTLNVGQGTGILVAADTISIDTSWADDRYVNVTGDTMTGTLTVSAGGGDALVIRNGGDLRIYTPGNTGSALLYVDNDGELVTPGNLTVGGTGGNVCHNVGGTWYSCPTAGIGGSGTANYIPKFATSTTIDNSVIYQDGTKIGIGVIGTLAEKLEVAGNIKVAKFIDRDATAYFVDPSDTSVSARFRGGIQLREVSLPGAPATDELLVYSKDDGGISKLYMKDSAGTETLIGAAGAPTGASYLVLGLDGNLSAERVLAAGAGLTSLDGGANGNYTLSLNTAAISTCTDTTQKLLWDSTNNRLTCATDQTGAITWPLLAPDGTAVAPSYSFTNNSNLGIFRPAADTLAFATAGSERVRIDGTGNVGIGTTGLTEKLTVQSDSGGRGIVSLNQIGVDNWSGLKIDRDGLEKWFIGISTTDDLILRRGGTTNDLVIDTTGNVSIPTGDLTLGGTGGNVCHQVGGTWYSCPVTGAQNLLSVLNQGADASSFTGDVRIGGGLNAARLAIGSGLPYWITKDGDSIALKNDVGDIKFVIGQDGNVGIGTTGPVSLLSVGSTSQFQVNSSGNLAKINNLSYSWPTTQASGFLKNDGSGTLSWAAAIGGYSTIQEEGTALTQRANLNFIGSAITAADDSVNSRTNLTLSQSPSGSTSVVGTGRLISTTSPLSGGGDLSSDRTLSLAGLTTLGTANYLVGVNSGATSWEYKNIVGTGSEIDITHTAGQVQIGLVDPLVLSKGGTGANLTAVSGGIVYSGASALAISAAGTSGRALVSGGTGAPTWFAPTAGSVIFAGTNGILAQDNANLFWDNTNKRLGIGTTTPGYKLDVRETAGGTATAIININQDNATKLWTGLRMARLGAEKWFVGMNNADDNFRVRRNGDTDDLIINTSGNATISGTLNVNTAGGNVCLSDGSNCPILASAGGWTDDGTVVRLTTASDNVGIGTATPGSYKLKVEGDGNITGYLVVGGGLTYKITKDGDSIAFQNNAGSNCFKFGQDGNLVIGGCSNSKLTAPTIDPQYEIDGKTYATYVSDYAGGVRVETSGKAELNENKIYIIDFDNLEAGSDLWLFAKICDFGKNMENLVVLLTAEGNQANLWYELNSSENQISIQADRPTKFSFRLSAPREDWKSHPNLVSSIY